jgi:hypothetical protein
MNPLTKAYLEERATEALSKYFGVNTMPTVENIGKMLHGMNWELAKDPFSKQFLENVAYNSSESFHLVLYLQYTHNK